MDERRNIRDGDGSKKMSELPQPLLHHILSFLSLKDAVRTCALSPTWRQVWCTRPNIEFDEDAEFFEGKPETFRSVFDETLSKTLQGYHDQDLSIEEFKVSTTQIPNSEFVSLLDRWIPIAILNMRAKKFHLHLYSYLCSYDLPRVVFESKFLQELYVTGCKLVSLDKILCKNLTELRFQNVHIEDEMFQSIISSCPLIDDITVYDCHGLGTIQIHEKQLHNLKYFDYSGISEETKIHLPSTVENIGIRNTKKWLVVNKFINLKSLVLYSVWLSGKWFNYFSCNFPFLEILKLTKCYGFDELQLSSHSIKQFTFINDDGSTRDVNVDAPNLNFFEYGYNLPRSISFATTASTNKLKSYLNGLCVKSSDDVDKWFLKLNEVLLSLSQSEISLDISLNGKSNIASADYGGNGGGDSYKPLVVDHLTLDCTWSPTFFAASILNGLFHICHPRFIAGCYWYVGACDEWKTEQNEFVQFLLCNILLLRQDLEQVGIEVEIGEGKWCPLCGTILSKCVFPSNQWRQNIRFRLKWRE